MNWIEKLRNSWRSFLQKHFFLATALVAFGLVVLVALALYFMPPSPFSTSEKKETKDTTERVVCDEKSDLQKQELVGKIITLRQEASSCSNRPGLTDSERFNCLWMRLQANTADIARYRSSSSSQ